MLGFTWVPAIEKLLVIVGNFFDATLYVIVRFGVSLKWVLYSHTI